MSSSAKIAIVAALEREVRPLVKDWSISENAFADKRFKFYECGSAVLICGGIGAQTAERATEAIASLYNPTIILSVGYAGALDHSLKVGSVVRPSRVINTSTGDMTELQYGEGYALLSTATIADAKEKAALAAHYHANSVDMEATAVARVADAHHVSCAAIKVVSDESDFSLPAMGNFISEDGQFRTTAFALHCALRPDLWASVIRLARNSKIASDVLCHELQRFITEHAAKGSSDAKMDNSARIEHQTKEQVMEEIRK